MIEEKFEKIYDFEFCKRLLEKTSNNWKKMRFEIEQSIFGIVQEYNLAYLIKINFETYLKKLEKSQIMVKLNEKNIMFINRMSPMKKKVTIRIPYENYDTSYPFLNEVNQLVSSDGVVALFANNIPYSLEHGVVIETLKNFEEIIELAEKYSYQLDYSFGITELFEGMQHRQYNVADIGQFMTLEEIKLRVSTVILFDSKTGLENKGVGFHRPHKKKVFISYSHKNKDEVSEIVSQLQSFGLNVWWDQQDIDFGDSIMESVQEGVNESDLWLFFFE